MVRRRGTCEGRLQGQAENDINENGRRQADRNGARLSGLIADANALISWQVRCARTRETMERVRAAMGLDPTAYRTDGRLVEVSFGDWQGYTFAELEAAEPGVTKARKRNKWLFVPPGEGAESYQMLMERVRPWLDAVRQPTVCVTHGGVMRTLFRMILGTEPEDAATLEIYQDRILRLQDNRLDWL